MSWCEANQVDYVLGIAKKHTTFVLNCSPDEEGTSALGAKR